MIELNSPCQQLFFSLYKLIALTAFWTDHLKYTPMASKVAWQVKALDATRDDLNIILRIHVKVNSYNWSLLGWSPLCRGEACIH